MLPSGKIGAADLGLLHVTDDVDEAVARIVESNKGRSAQEQAEKQATDGLRRDVGTT